MPGASQCLERPPLQTGTRPADAVHQGPSPERCPRVSETWRVLAWSPSMESSLESCEVLAWSPSLECMESQEVLLELLSSKSGLRPGEDDQDAQRVRRPC